MEASVEFWTKSIGAGPFFLMRDVEVGAPRYKGEPSQLKFDVAIGYWGDIQIELFRQNNDVPSVYKAHRDAGRESLHHVCIIVDDANLVRRAIEARGGEVVYEGATLPSGTPFFYADMKGGPDLPLVEVLQSSDGIVAFFKMMREAARDWNGSNPLRILK
ncbi:MAG: VOC family protein [Rhodospirillales bacterium]|nr:VOC family protein [Rhodospirillales bacterium]